MKATLRPARPAEAPAITDLCLRSKATWGYDDVFMDACRAELTLTPESIEDSRVQVAVAAGQLAGVAQFTVGKPYARLEKLFVDPTAVGLGIGSALLEWAKCAARETGADALFIDSDPGAAGFYRRFGAEDVGLTPSESIPGRFIPELRLDVRW